ncbi:MAG TPA: tryptophan synthase subunit alpha [Gemmataceae bacterium]|jgi:tryptophan synthase alpha chain|nr:tryptophan synthase subunit alpha [Gemmataceae bacterium]
MLSANPIDDLFRRLRLRREKAFIPFLAAGDPDIAATSRLIRELDSLGAHLIEIGFPFSDPIADGPVIQASYTRALDRGLKLDDVFHCVEVVKRKATPVAAPIVGMASYTLIYRRGMETFLDQAIQAGFWGAIVPDLPVEEAEPLAKLAATKNFRLILLVTPTTPPKRAERIVKLCTGFVYCVSVAGITGERDRLPDELHEQLRRLRTMTDLPLCVGFGISKPAHVQMLREIADGIIVGSAIVRRLEGVNAAKLDEAIVQIRELVRGLMTALNPK